MAAKFTLEAIWKGVDRMTAPVTRMGNKVGKVTRSMRKNINKVNDAFKRVGKTARTAFGVAGVAGAAFVAQRAIRAVITTGADFEQILVGAGARFDLNIRRGTVAFKELEEAARTVGKSTEFTSSEAAGGLNFMAKAGLTARQSIALLPGMVDLATAAEIDLARATDIATDSLNAFGLATADPIQQQRNFTVMSDQMAKATIISNQNFEELFGTIKKGAPAATAAGASMSELLAVSSAFASAGLKATDSGTALKNIYLKLASIDVQDTLDDLGVDALDKVTRELRPFADIMDDLVKSTSDLSKTERVGLINQMFGLRGVTGVATVLAAGVDSVREFERQIIDSIGLTVDLASVIRDTLGAEMKELSSAVENTQISFFKANQGGLSIFVTGLTDVVRAIDKYMQAEPQIAQGTATIVALGAAAAVAGLALAGVAAALSFIVGSTTALIGLGVLGVGGLVAFADSQRGPQTVPGMGGAFNAMANEQRERLDRDSREKLMGPQDRFGRALDRLGSMSLAELRILAPPGTAELTGDGGPNIKLTFDEFEDF